MVTFTAEQQAQLDRLSARRRAALDDEKLAKRTPDELRTRVNILGVSGTVTFAPQSDYTDADKALIAAVRPRTKWLTAIPELLTRAEVLRAGGMSEAAIGVVLKGGG